MAFPKRKSAAQSGMIVEVPKGKRGGKSQTANEQPPSPALSPEEEEEHQAEEEQEKPKRKRGRPSNKEREEAAAKLKEKEEGKAKGKGKDKDVPTSKVESKTPAKPSLPSLQQFLKDAENIYINMMEDKNGEFDLQAKPKAFATGSYGWSINDNHEWYVGEDLLPISISINITVQGSSSAPRDNDTGTSGSGVGRKRKSDA